MFYPQLGGKGLEKVGPTPSWRGRNQAGGVESRYKLCLIKDSKTLRSKRKLCHFHLPSPLLSNKHTSINTKVFVGRTNMCLRKVTCPLRVNFVFFIEIAKMSYLELFFIWCQFFTTSGPKKNDTKANLAST